MNRMVKRIVIGGGVGAGVLAALFGGLTAFRNLSRKPVNVYHVQDVAMTDYWADAKETYGYVTTDQLQNVFLSSTETVTEVFVQQGQTVKKGDPLFSFDTTLSELNLKKAENDLLQKRRALEKAQAQLEKLKKTKPYQEPSVIDPVYPDPEEPSDPEEPQIHSMETPRLLSGSGTREDPFVYLWGSDDELGEAFFGEVVEEMIRLGRVPDTYRVKESVLTGANKDEASEEDAIPEDVDETDSAAEYTETEPEVSSAPMQPEVTSREPDADAYLILEHHMHDDPEMETTMSWGIRIRRASGKLYTSLFDPSLRSVSDNELTDDDLFGEEFGGGDSGSDSGSKEPEMTYTKEELAQAINDTNKEIRDTTLEVKLAEVELKRMKEEMGDGTVRAKIDGTVKKVMDPQEAYKNNKAFITVSAGGGYNIQIPVSELLLNKFSKGQTVSVMANESGVSAEGTVKAISLYPTGDFGWGGGNPNVSYYPCLVFVDESVEMKENEFVTVTYQDGQEASDGKTFYLEKMFIRTDASGSYVYVKDSNGLLEKRKIVTGRDLGWGSMEIKSGLSLKDQIAFPYGSNVTEAAKTKDAQIDDLYSGM